MKVIFELWLIYQYIEATYQMEYYFRKYTEDKDSPGPFIT